MLLSPCAPFRHISDTLPNFRRIMRTLIARTWCSSLRASKSRFTPARTRARVKWSSTSLLAWHYQCPRVSTLSRTQDHKTPRYQAPAPALALALATQTCVCPHRTPTDPTTTTATTYARCPTRTRATPMQFLAPEVPAEV